MANPYLILWADPTVNKLYSGWKQNTEARTPIIKQGDEVGVELHWVQKGSLASTMQEIAFPPSAAITLAIGRLDTAPIGGTFTLTYGANTTAPLAYDISATALQTALNGLASITAEGGVTVTKSGVQFRIVWDDAGPYTTSLTSDVDGLYPTSNASIVETKAGSATTQRIILFKVKQAFIAALQTFTATATPTIATSNVYGDTWRVSIDTPPKEGVFSLVITNGATPYVTAPVSYDADETEMLTALNALGITGTFTVTRSGDYMWDVSVPSTVSNVQTQSGLIGFSSMYGVLDMNTAECEEFLAGSDSATATLEVQVDVGGEIQTLIRTNIQILNDLIDVSSFNVVALEDVMPVDSVVRYDTSQALTSTQKLQARQNIGAIDDSSISAIEADIISLDGRVTVVEGYTDQNVKVASDVTFKSLSVTNTSGNALQYMPSGDGNKVYIQSDGTLAGKHVLSGIDSKSWSINSSGIGFINVSTGLGTTITASGIQLSLGGLITFGDGTTQSTAVSTSTFLTKSGNLSGLTDLITARTNLGLGTMAVETATNYLTVATASSTYLTKIVADGYYQPLMDQTLNTTDSATFTSVNVGVVGVLQTSIAASGVIFSSGNELQDVAHSAGTIQSSGTGNPIHDDDYPDEMTLVIAGTTYRVPARTI